MRVLGSADQRASRHIMHLPDVAAAAVARTAARGVVGRVEQLDLQVAIGEAQHGSVQPVNSAEPRMEADGYRRGQTATTRPFFFRDSFGKAAGSSGADSPKPCRSVVIRGGPGSVRSLQTAHADGHRVLIQPQLVGPQRPSLDGDLLPQQFERD